MVFLPKMLFGAHVLWLALVTLTRSERRRGA